MIHRLCACVLLASSTLHAADPVVNPVEQPIPMSDITVKLQLVAEGLNSPVDLCPMPGAPGRLFVADQPGLIRLIEDGKLVSQPVADMRPLMIEMRKGFDERGLLGVVFHPDFATAGAPGEGRLYTYYSAPADPQATSDFPLDMTINGAKLPLDHQAVINEWRLNPDGRTIDMNSRREVMRIDQPQFNHNGGQIVFGPDKMLYISLGDGGAGNDVGPGHTDVLGNAQDLSKGLGKILRIDPLGLAGKKVAGGAYSVPADNPFVGRENARPEIWALGLRNVWRMSFTPDGKLVGGDVGQDQIEEIVIIEKGDNHGWNFMEGPFYFDPTAPKGRNIFHKFTGTRFLPAMMKNPIAFFDHDEGISVIGGYVYQGSAVPALKGKYIFGEWTDINENKKPTKAGRLMFINLGETDPQIREIAVDGGMPGYVTALGQGADGEFYVMTNAHAGPTGDAGKIWRLAR